MSQTRDQQCFTISEVAADCHEPMVPHCCSALCGHPLAALTDNWTHGTRRVGDGDADHLPPSVSVMYHRHWLSSAHDWRLFCFPKPTGHHRSASVIVSAVKFVCMNTNLLTYLLTTFPHNVTGYETRVRLTLLDVILWLFCLLIAVDVHRYHS